MPSPFSGFSGNIGPQTDVYTPYVNSQAPIAEGIIALGKGIGAYRDKKQKQEEDAKDREAKARSDKEKMDWERNKFRIEQEAAAEKAKYDRIKVYLDQKTKEKELRIKGSEGKYERLKGRIDDIDSQIGGYRTAYPEGVPPEVAQRIAELETLKKGIGDQMVTVGQEIESAYDDNDNISSYLQEYDGWMQRRNGERQIQLENYGAPTEPVDPLSSSRMPDGSIDPSAINVTDGGIKIDPYRMSENVIINGPGNSPIFQGGGTGVLSGPEPKFPSTDSNSRPNATLVSDSRSAGSRFGGGAGGGGSGGGTGGGLGGSSQGGGQGGNGSLQGFGGSFGSGRLALQPVGSNPYATEVSSKWSTANVYEDQAPDSRTDGGRIVWDAQNNRYSLAINPDASDKNREVLNRLGAITAFSNGMSNEQAFRLSGMLRDDRASQAAGLYKVLKEKGMIPKEMDFVRFKAAVASSLYSENNSSLGNLTAEQATDFGAVIRTTRPDESVESIEASALNRAAPITSPATTPNIEIAPSIPATTWRPPFDVERTKRLMASGLYPRGEKTKAMFELAKFLDNQGMALARLRAQQQSAAASVAAAETGMIKGNSEAAEKTGMLEALLPGIGNSVGREDVTFYNRTLGNADNVDISSVWRNEAKKNGNLAAWDMIVGNYGFYEKLEKERYQNAVDASTSFERGFGGAMTIMSLFESQMGKNWGELTYERIVGDKAAVAAQYRLFLLGAFRKATVGLGNPSNFEQELLLNLIPDPTSPFQITQKSVAKARMLTLMTVANHITDMEAAKFVMSEKSAEYYSRKLVEAGVLSAGQKLTVSDFKQFKSILRRNAGDPAGSINELRVWARNTQSGGVSNLVEQIAGEMNIRGGTREAYTVDRNVRQFLLVDTAHLDPSNQVLQRR